MTLAAVTWPETPGWYWAHGRIAGMELPDLLSALAVLEDDGIAVYLGGTMTHRLSAPDLDLPLQFKPAALPSFDGDDSGAYDESPYSSEVFLDSDGERHDSKESAEEFDALLAIAKKLPEFVWSLSPYMDFDKVVFIMPHPNQGARAPDYVVSLRLIADVVGGELTAQFERVVYYDKDDHPQRSWVDTFPDQAKLEALEMIERLTGLGMKIDASSLTDASISEIFDPECDL